MRRVAAAADVRTEIRLIRRGRRIKADIKSVSIGSARAVLKDFASRPWPVRLIGRIQIAREMRALARLRGLPGVPACFGRWGRYGLLIERVDGERITRYCERRPEGVGPMITRLEDLVRQMHERGVVHLDLRKRDNILIDPEGHPRIIDFNASFCFPPGRSLRASLLLPLLRRIDASALLKWKLRHRPHLVGPGEVLRHRRMTFLRRLWIFN